MTNGEKLLKLDFIQETGELIASFGLAVAAAASAERVDVLEMALKQCRAALLEAIAEFKQLDGGGAE